jgi:hypothetical protein
MPNLRHRASYIPGFRKGVTRGAVYRTGTPVLLVGNSVHSHRRLLAKAVIGPLQGRLVDQTSQRIELGFRFSLRSFRYLAKFR